jgi:hypothetical protein
MHVVEHHDDLFSWKKNNNYMHVNYVWNVRMRYKACYLKLAINGTCKIIVFSLC